MRELEKERVKEFLESSGSKEKKGEDVLCGGYTCVERSFWKVMGIRVWWTKYKRKKKRKKKEERYG